MRTFLIIIGIFLLALIAGRIFRICEKLAEIHKILSTLLNVLQQVKNNLNNKIDRL